LYLEKSKSLFTKLDSSGYFNRSETVGELRLSAAFKQLGQTNGSDPFFEEYRIASNAIE